MSNDRGIVRAFGTGREAVRAVLIVVLVALVIGGLTSPAQQYLPRGIGSVANAAGPWMVVVLVALYVARARLVLSLILGVVGFVLLNVGYAVVSSLRGFPYSAANFWTIAAIPAGLAIGLSANWLRSSVGVRVALAVAIPAGILLGEGLYGLTVVLNTTGPWVWTLELLAAVVLLALVSARRLRSPRLILLATGLAVAIAAAFYLTFRLL